MNLLRLPPPRSRSRRHARSRHQLHRLPDVGPSGPHLWLTVPNEPGTGIDQARIEQGKRLVTGKTRDAPRIAQSAL